jgi:hypothetical protein
LQNRARFERETVESLSKAFRNSSRSVDDRADYGGFFRKMVEEFTQ